MAGARNIILDWSLVCWFSYKKYVFKDILSQIIVTTVIIIFN